jgi:hypothetical protein
VRPPNARKTSLAGEFVEPQYQRAERSKFGEHLDQGKCVPKPPVRVQVPRHPHHVRGALAAGFLGLLTGRLLCIEVLGDGAQELFRNGRATPVPSSANWAA